MDGPGVEVQENPGALRAHPCIQGVLRSRPAAMSWSFTGGSRAFRRPGVPPGAPRSDGRARLGAGVAARENEHYLLRLAPTKERHPQGVPDVQAPHGPGEPFWRVHRLVVEVCDDVAAEEQGFPAEDHVQLPAADPGLLGRASRLHNLDDEAVREGKPEQLFQRRNNEMPLDPQPGANDVSLSSSAGRMACTTSIGTAKADILRVGEDGGGEADDLAAAVEEGPTRVAGVDRRIRLDHGLHEREGHIGEDSVDGRDDPPRQGLIEAEGISDRQHLLSDAGRAELPGSATGSVPVEGGGIRSTATSKTGSAPITVPGTVVPSSRVTMMACRPKTTCEFVSTRPLASRITPEPTARLTRSAVLIGVDRHGGNRDDGGRDAVIDGGDGVRALSVTRAGEAGGAEHGGTGDQGGQEEHEAKVADGPVAERGSVMCSLPGWLSVRGRDDRYRRVRRTGNRSPDVFYHGYPSRSMAIGPVRYDVPSREASP